MGVASSSWFDRVLLSILHMSEPSCRPMFKPPSSGPPLAPLKGMHPPTGSRPRFGIRPPSHSGAPYPTAEASAPPPGMMDYDSIRHEIMITHHVDSVMLNIDMCINLLASADRSATMREPAPEAPGVCRWKRCSLWGRGVTYHV